MTTIDNNGMSKATTDGGAPIRKSPLHSIHETLQAQFEERAGWQVPSTYEPFDEEEAAVQQRIGVCDVSATGSLRVRGKQARSVLVATFDVVLATIGDVVVITSDSNRRTIASLTEDEFLILTRPSTYAELRAVEQTITRQRKDDQFVTIVDQTAGLAGLLIVGPRSRDLLSKLFPLSFRSDAFPNLRVAQSSLAKVHATIIRSDLGEMPAFEVYMDRSYAAYVWESVMDAGNEFGVVPVGWRTIESFARERTHASEGV